MQIVMFFLIILLIPAIGVFTYLSFVMFGGYKIYKSPADIAACCLCALMASLSLGVMMYNIIILSGFPV